MVRDSVGLTMSLHLPSAKPDPKSPRFSEGTGWKGAEGRIPHPEKGGRQLHFGGLSSRGARRGILNRMEEPSEGIYVPLLLLA